MIDYLLFKIRKGLPMPIRQNLKGLYSKIKKIAEKNRLYSKFMERRQHKKEVEFFRKMIPRNSLVFDIGANEGNMTQVFLDAGAGKVIAVEPHPQCAKNLEKRFRKKPVKVIEKGAGSKQGNLTFYITKKGSATSTYSDTWIKKRFRDETYIPIKTKITTLKALIKEHGPPSFCKIDVEGFEKEVFKGLDDARIERIFFEFTFGYLEDVEKCFEILSKNRDYVCNFSFENTCKFEIRNMVSPKELIKILRKYDNGKYIGGDVYLKERTNFLPKTDTIRKK